MTGQILPDHEDNLGLGAGPGGGAPDDADYLVGTANGGLSAEIVVGTTPGGELGGTWGSPTVDATHSGSTHAGAAASAVTTHEGASDPHTGYRLESADHTHATTGLQAGQVAHAALSGIAATDHHAAPAAGPDANVTVDAAGAAGTASTFARSGHGHQVVTDSGVASTQAFGDSATAGTSGTIQRQGHKHAWPALGTTAAAIGTSAGGAATTPSKSDHVHATGAGTPSTQAFGDAAATGSGPAAAMTDHKHAMPAATLTRKFFLNIPMGTTDAGSVTTQGTLPDRATVDNLADAATQGHYWTFMVPSDWASGVLTAQPVWGPSATDAASHTVRWSMDTKELAAGIDISAAGTTVAFTGASAARTIRQVVYDTATSTTVTPSAAGNLVMFNLRRVGGDGADSYVGVVQLLGVVISYTANR